MSQPQSISLQERLAASLSPVERDVAALLSCFPLAGDADGVFRLQRYHRKIDVAHKLMAAYDERIDKATATSTVSSDCYLGLAMVFIQAAHHESGPNEATRANALRWVNSAFNCLDHVNTKDARDMDAELQALLRKGSWP
jgi:hypothetical protein